MYLKSQIDTLLDGEPWEREVQPHQLDGVEQTYLRNAERGVAIQEPQAVREMSFRAFNLLTLVAHDYVRVLRFFMSEYEGQIDDSHVEDWDREDWRLTDVESTVNHRPVLRRQGVNAIAEMWRQVEQPRFQHAVRYYVRPHARLIRLNYNQFPATLIGPLWPGSQTVYRGSGKPTRIVPSSNNSPLSQW